MSFLSTKLAKFMALLAVSLGMTSAYAVAPAAPAGGLPPEVLTGISTAGTNLATAATAIIIALIAFWGLRKLAQKMGWW